MAFSTSADIQKGYYGTNKYDINKNRYVFAPLGKAVTIDGITESIETGFVTLSLSWEYQGEKRHLDMPREAITDHTLLQELVHRGADITKQHFNTFVDSLRLQEHQREVSGSGVKKVFSDLGWIKIPSTDATGAKVEKLCYRAANLVGTGTAEYAGNLQVTPQGTFADWRTMVTDEIIGHVPAEVVMLASLAAVVNGLIAPHTTGENPIIHLNGLSGTGKSAIAMAAASVFGEPFDGERRRYDADGTPKSLRSVYGSWGATENATLGRCAGNRGCVIILNELGKFKGSDLTSIIYNFGDGTDKDRMNSNLKITKLEGYTTTIISVGELSLLSRCQSKAEGLANRVLELDMPMTTSAENADRMKKSARENNGWAAPMLADFIIRNGGLKMVVDLFDSCYTELLAVWPEAPSRDRFVRKFPALFLTTAKLASAALDLTFSEEAIIDFFIEREKQQGGERNTAADSYDMIISQCSINPHRFYVQSDASYTGRNPLREERSLPKAECWGRITNMRKVSSDGRVITQEIELYPHIIESLLKAHGYQNLKSCVKAWRDAGVLHSYDEKHPCCKRKIDPNAPVGTTVPVYVFRVFCDPTEVQVHLDALATQKAVKPKKKLLLHPSSTRELLVTEGGDDGEASHTA